MSGRFLPWFSPLSRRALRLYYRFRAVGEPPPRTGPLLLVANHPNSLLDPAAVCAVAGRPVRFLAKAPLFSMPIIGPLVRACGAIPVHRRQDDPGLMHRNEETFRAAYAALAAGDAVGIFPEGISHSDPALAPLRTGAARIVLGAAARGARAVNPGERAGERPGGAFPILPVGLVLRDKDRFRSEALAVVGEPVPWSDLAGRAAGDEEAVRLLTERIDRALRSVTLNLERWEDAAVVECAEAVYAAEYALPTAPGERLRRLAEVARALAALRRREPEALASLYEALARYGALLRRLELRPDELRRRGPRRAVAFRWSLRQALFFGLAAPAAAIGHLVFFIPYRIVAALARHRSVEKDVRATVKLLGGAVVYGAWILLLAVVAGRFFGAAVGALTPAALLALGLLTLRVRERWAEARTEARAYLLLRERDALRRRLLARRRELAERLEAIRRERLDAGPEPVTLAAPAAGTPGPARE